jgi:hypothetical protein
MCNVMLDFIGRILSVMGNMLNADYGCRVHSTSSASQDMMLLDASCHMVASTVLVTIMHPSNA